MLKAVKGAHGVMHLLFHPGTSTSLRVADAIVTAVRKAKSAGLEWWTARQIHQWEFARRSVEWIDCDDSSITLRSRSKLADATFSG